MDANGREYRRVETGLSNGSIYRLVHGIATAIVSGHFADR